MNYEEKSLEMHRKLKGKIAIVSKVRVNSKEDLSIAYTPGVAAVSMEIAKDKEKAYEYTPKGNMVAVVSDGTAVLGLGDIGPYAALPVMEGKAVLFKEFAGIDAVPITLDTKDVDEIIRTVTLIAPAFGGINLEDISAPRCFEIEKRLDAELDIPVFHDDQHGTAIVVLAGLINALGLAGKDIGDAKIVFSGAGAAGIAITRLLLQYGAKDIILTDSKGAIYKGREGLNPIKEQMSLVTNLRMQKGSLKDVIRGADVFVGVSAPGVLSMDMVRSMEKPIIFAMSNPVPEIMPEDAVKAGAFIVATGRSDYPNQINNVLVFPGIFRGALDARTKITDDIKIAAAKAIAGMVSPTIGQIVPFPSKEVAIKVADEVKVCASQGCR